MLSDPPKPVSGIEIIRLLPMQDRMPVRSFNRLVLLRDFMGGIEARKIQPEPGVRPSGVSRILKEIGTDQSAQPACGSITDKRQQALAVSIETQ